MKIQLRKENNLEINSTIIFIMSLFMAGLIGQVIASGDIKVNLLLFGASIASGIFLLSIRNPRIPFFLLVFFMPYEAVVQLPGLPNPVLLVFGGITFITWAIGLMVLRSGIFRSGGIAGLFALILIVWTLLAALNANGLVGIITSARPYWLVIVFFFLTYNTLTREKDVYWMGIILSLSLGITGLMIVIQLLLFIARTGVISGQQLHVFANSSTVLGTSAQNLSIWLAKGIPFAYYLSQKDVEANPHKRKLLFISLLFMILGIMATFSLTGVFGLIATLGFIVIFSRNRIQRRFMVAVSVVLIIATLISPIGERISAQLDVVMRGDLTKVGSNRGLAWTTAYTIINRNMFLGVGPSRDNVWNATAEVLPESFLQSREKVGKGIGLEAHNAYLAVGMQLGVPGLLVFILLIFSIILPLWNNIRYQRKLTKYPKLTYLGQAVFIGIAVYVLQGLVNDTNLEKIFWLLLGAGISLNYIFRDRITETSSPGKEFSKKPDYQTI